MMNQIEKNEKKWFAVYTRSKAEKAAFRELERKGVQVYLPLQKKVRVYTRKRKVVELPLISSYIFVKINRGQYVSVLETSSVINFVKFSSKLISIPEREIDLLKRILGEGWEVEIEEQNFREGDLVEVQSGNLCGLRGRLVGNSNNKYLSVDFNTLSCSLKVFIDRSLLAKVYELKRITA